MSKRNQLKQLANHFSQENLIQFFRSAHENFRPNEQSQPHFVEEEPEFLVSVHNVGEIELDLDEVLIIYRLETQDDITNRTSKRRQYELAKKILKKERSDAGFFVFHDDRGHFRFSLVVTHYDKAKRQYTPFRRYTYYVTPEKPNKTFINQIGKANFSTIDTILKAFSIEAVSEDFYNEFKPKFDEIAQAVEGSDVETGLKEDFALLFIIRIIFLGFVQKKGWLGDDEEFLQKYWQEYKSQFEGNVEFYSRWLRPLFFEALNSPPGRKVKYRNNEFSDDTEAALQQAPYLNGDLFKKKKGYDDIGLCIPDEQIGDFFDFLFQYNFTIEENRYYDEELELNPEFLGLIFERLVNKEDGAIYTPRTEVDFMCRMALVKWLQKNTSCDTRDLYHLFFREMGSADEFDKHQKHGDFSQVELKELIEKLENVTACDPAAGSGAFEVGMMHVLHEVLGNLYKRPNKPDNIATKSGFELKKAIIAQSLYGVEVKEWAVWINHLRLWLTMFIDMPDDEKNSMKPLLPSLNFKVRCGDSLVQRIGSKLFPVQGHAHLKKGMKQRITTLKQKKIDFFHNRGVSADEVQHAEFSLFRDIIRTELDEKRQKMNILENKKVEQTNLDFGLPESADPQQKIDLYEKEKRRLQDEIDELVEQEQNLAEQHPLIWNIEFAEIFYDRGGFDIIIGNPPYLSKEDIGDPYNQIDTSTYKKFLKKAVYEEYPNYFYKNLANKKVANKISGQTDLSVYFYLKTLNLLNSNGIHVFISTNAWLDVGYGTSLQRFLLKELNILCLFDNHAKRTFSTASVNTIISILELPEKPINQTDHVKFIAFYKPFEEVLTTEKLLNLENQVEQIEKNENYRSLIKTKDQLILSGSEFKEQNKIFNGLKDYKGEKWLSKYLRAPLFYERLIDDKLKKLNKFGRVKLGITSCQNDFFYLNASKVNEFNIPQMYLEPIFKTPKEVVQPYVSLESLSLKVFLYDKNHIEESVKSYIRFGKENDVHKVKCLQGRRLWYNLGQPEKSQIFLPYSYNDTFKTYISDKPLICDKRLVQFFHFDEYDIKPVVLFMNSTLWGLILEVNGSTNLGEGALVFNTKDFRKLPFKYIEELNDLEEAILNRKTLDVFAESDINPKSDTPIAEQEPQPKPDRVELDTIVFDALGLTEEERKEVYRAVCQLVWNRVSKAQSV